MASNARPSPPNKVPPLNLLIRELLELPLSRMVLRTEEKGMECGLVGGEGEGGEKQGNGILENVRSGKF